MATSLQGFERKLVAVGKEFDGSAGLARLKRVAMDTKGDIDVAVKGDLGDSSMSGWRRGKEIEVMGAFKVEGSVVSMVPNNAGKGPMRVLQQGRNQGNAGGFAGPGMNNRTGVTTRNADGSIKKQRGRKAKRWNGRTDGKDTWTDATAIMADKVPARYAKEVHKAIGKHLTGG